MRLSAESVLSRISRRENSSRRMRRSRVWGNSPVSRDFMWLSESEPAGGGRATGRRYIRMWLIQDWTPARKRGGGGLVESVRRAAPAAPFGHESLKLRDDKVASGKSLHG